MKNRLASQTPQLVFAPSELAEKILRQGRILGADEKPDEMVERVVATLIEPEKWFGTEDQHIARLRHQLRYEIATCTVVPSTPVLTNAGRHKGKPLTACAVPPLSLKGDWNDIKSLIDAYHIAGMGTGFNLSEVSDPATALRSLNQIAVAGATSGLEDRPVGNMAVCSARHPRILDFVRAKAGVHRDEVWKFNISVDVDNEIIAAVKTRRSFNDYDGAAVDATQLMCAIAEAACDCGDPGIVCLERLNADNPTPDVGNYVSTAPCAEVGLAPGETCQFIYVNVGNFVHGYSIDFSRLKHVVHLVTRVLDNAVEISIRNATTSESKKVMSAKRKIGVGVCGVADMLAKLRTPYASTGARHLVNQVLQFINYQSKVASYRLARTRGAFGAIEGSRHLSEIPMIEQKFAVKRELYPQPVDWQRLSDLIKKTKLLRNATTTALPPTGRSALVFGASTGVEPYFALAMEDEISPVLMEVVRQEGVALSKRDAAKIKSTGSVEDTSLSDWTKRVFETATQISPQAHLQMAAAAQFATDEAVAKTINMPNSATPSVFFQTYVAAFDMGLKGVALYRDKSRAQQPKNLTIAKE